MNITQENLEWLTCSFVDKCINVCKKGEQQESLFFNFEIPHSILEYLASIGKTDPRLTALTYHAPTNIVNWKNSVDHYNFQDSEYNQLVAPLVTLFETEKDRLEQEQIQAQQEYDKFENRKERALDSIVNDYHTALEKGFVRTSLGFDADISPDSVATLSATNIALTRNLFAEETPKTVFRDFYGLKRELDKVQVELLICQINIAQNYIRELKYEFKSKIKETFDNESLNTALDACVYSTLDFSKLTETNNPTVIPFEQFANYVQRIDAF